MDVIWTVLPNGLTPDGATARLSVFVSPRLSFRDDREGTLADFPDFVDWPSRLQAGALNLSLVFDGDAEHPRPVEIVTGVEPDSAFWRALFSPSTFVRSRKAGFNGAREPVSSYPATVIANRVTDGYRTIGEKSPYAPVDRRQLTDAFPEIRSALTAGGQRSRARIFKRLRDPDSISDAELEAAHKEIAENLLRHEPRASFSDRLSGATGLAGRRARLRDEGVAVLLIPETDSPASPFVQFAAFHRRVPLAREREGVRREQEKRDFHQILAALAEYPDVLRSLGLIIDLQLPASEIPSSAFGSVRHLQVALEFGGSQPSFRSHTPLTKYLFDPAAGSSVLPLPHFCPAPNGSNAAAGNAALGVDLEVIGGLLNLGIPSPLDSSRGAQFGLIQFDVDGAGLKLLNALADFGAGSKRPPIDDPMERGAPALRTSGLSMVREKLGNALVAAMDQAGAHEASLGNGGQQVFFAEDLVRGYRVDIRQFPSGFDFTDPAAVRALGWRSLHQRVGSFRLHQPEQREFEFEDEGFIQPAIVQDVTPQEVGRENKVQPLYVSESVFNWQGWSLSTPRPATPIDTGDSPAPPGPGSLQGLPDATVDIEPSPFTLPRLRFGSHYQVRVRTVDLAGNGLSVEEADRVLAALEDHGRKQPLLPPKPRDFQYRRFDPMLPPVLVLRAEPTEGEEPDVMVIRSNAGVSAEDYADTLGDAYSGTTERHVVPPKTAQLMAEAHGLLEGAFGRNGDPARFYKICKKEGGTLNDATVINTRTGLPEPLPDVLRQEKSGAEVNIKNGLRLRKTEGATAGYTIHFEEQLVVPYLPDPLARGASLFGLPGVEGKSGLLGAGMSEIEWTGPEQMVLPLEAQRQLGYITRIRYEGGWPDILPFRIRLTEPPDGATEILPNWDALSRVLTVCLPKGMTRTVWVSSHPDRDDLALLGLYNWWSDRVATAEEEGAFLRTAELGALALLTPARKLTLVHAVQMPLRLATASPAGSLGVRRFPRDTTIYFSGEFRIHGPSTAKIDLLATWEEPDDVGGAPRTFTTHVLELPIHPAGVQFTDRGRPPVATYAENAESMRFVAPEPSADAARRLHPARQDFGDTKHRKVTYKLVATTRFPEYFPKEITADPKNITRSLELREIVPSSAPPAAPEITSILPVFLWCEETTPTHRLIERRRGGGSLRVYLGPRWHSSGEGEKLAVVQVTNSGLDPLHGSGSLSTPIKPAARHVDIPDEGRVYPYPVAFDQDRGFWYSDVSFDIGDAYFPFVRFSIARYQEHALNDMHLSPKVDAGIHQLLPSRTVRLSYPIPPPGSTTRTIVIVVEGVAGISVPSESRGYSVEVSLEERPAAQAPDPRDRDLGWTVATSVSQPFMDTLPLPTGVLWSGRVSVPASSAQTQRRIVIREFELFPPNRHPAGQAWIGEENEITHARRLVYADTIPL